MVKVQALATWLKSQLAARGYQVMVMAAMQTGDTTPTGKDYGGIPRVMSVIYHTYQGQVRIQHWTADLDLPLALAQVWMWEQGSKWTDKLLGWEEEAEDDETATLVLRVQLCDSLDYEDAPAGYTGQDYIDFQGKRLVPAGGKPSGKLTRIAGLRATVIP